MDYVLLSYCLIAASLGLMLGGLIGKKRLTFIPLILTILVILVFVMEKYDVENYYKLFKDIKNLDLYIFIYCVCLFLLTNVLVLVKKNKKMYKVFVNQENGEKIVVDDKLYYFNLMKQDYAYYNQENDTYVLNTFFRKSLGESKIEVPSSEFKKYMLLEDAQIYNNINNDEYTCNYRLKNINGYEWYEEISLMNGVNKIRIVYRIESKLGNDTYVGTYKDLEKDIQELNKSRQEYGLALSSIVSVKNMDLAIKERHRAYDGSEVYDKDLKNVIIAKYITKLLSNYYKDQIKVYRLANYEYAFLILNRRAYETFERELYTNTSEFIRCELNINNLKVNVHCKLGLVFSSYVKTNQNYHVINAAYDLLQMVISSSFKQDYALYQGINEQVKTYKLKDMGIDLENDIKNCLKNNEE